MSELPLLFRRRGSRRRFPAYCHALALDDGRVLGERLVDLSIRGALVALDDAATLGDGVLLSFQMPWRGPMVHTRARVERIVEGWREDDPGYCAGVRFLDLDEERQRELAERLSPLPPREPARRHPVDYARAVWRVSVGLDAPLAPR